MDHRKQIYEHYVSAGQSASSPADLSGLERRAPYLKRVIANHFPANREASIIDLGCGHGAFIYFIRQAGYQNVIGVDVSPEQVSEAPRLGIAGVKQGDLLEYLKILPTASQDLVIAFDVIEHFTKDELLPLACEVHRVLCENGKWILHTPNGEGLFGSRSYFSDFTHQTSFTRNSMVQFLGSMGFSNISCYEDKIVVHGWKSAIRYVIWESVQFILRVVLAAETGNLTNDYILSQNMLTVSFK